MNQNKMLELTPDEVFALILACDDKLEELNDMDCPGEEACGYIDDLESVVKRLRAMQPEVKS